MKERPILLYGHEVRAILEGRKTQIRRAVKFPKWIAPEDYDDAVFTMNKSHICEVPVYGSLLHNKHIWKCPYGKPGDKLWVRETTESDHDRCDTVVLSQYVADKEPVLYYSMCDDDGYNGSIAHWWYRKERCPSIHMPRWASRIDFEIVSVRIERLQDISEDDCDAEGFGGNSPPVAFPEFAHLKGWDGSGSIPQCFASLWESINGIGSWDKNPWVWVVEFRRVK